MTVTGSGNEEGSPDASNPTECPWFCSVWCQMSISGKVCAEWLTTDQIPHELSQAGESLRW